MKYVVRMSIALEVEGTVVGAVLPATLHAAENAAARALAENGATEVVARANTIERTEMRPRGKKGQPS